MPLVYVPDDWTRPTGPETQWTEVVLSEAAIGEFERKYPGKVRGVDPIALANMKVKRLKAQAAAARADAQTIINQAAAYEAAAAKAMAAAEAEAKEVAAGLKVATEVGGGTQ